MKKTIFLLLMIITGFQGFSQCTIDPWIQTNYERDAKFLLLRDILENPADPDFDNPFINETRLTPYLERLSAIYENPTNHPVIDSLFNEFKIHVNPEGGPPITPSKQLEFAVDNTTPWLEDFKNTGVSGVAALDNLMTTYQFSISEFIVLSSFTGFYIETGYDFLNVSALVDDFEAVPDAFYVETYIPIEARFNYTGIPYELEPGEFVEVCNIVINEDIFTFGIFAGDCPVGCYLSKTWDIQVSENCEVTVLDVLENDIAKLSIYPNPTSDKLYLSGNTSEIELLQIFSIHGKLIQKLNNISEEIDISTLSSGLYFLKLSSKEGKTNNLKFIKK
ncbi:T9SS type A sorting domain-containing protein [Aequorivita viscosa]|nr:T9SS type A sorting domain-containing protein [Aequorivita viscosa]